MAKRIRCHCQGNPACKLCIGDSFYQYEAGPGGYLPFRCPTCDGSRAVNGSACYTCRGAGFVDPADPPFAPGVRGFLRIAWKVAFGGG